MANPSRIRSCALAAASVAILVLCLLADWRFRPVGAVRIALWGAGLVLYGILLSAVAGPVLDHRDRRRPPSAR